MICLLVCSFPFVCCCFGGLFVCFCSVFLLFSLSLLLLLLFFTFCLFVLLLFCIMFPTEWKIINSSHTAQTDSWLAKRIRECRWVQNNTDCHISTDWPILKANQLCDIVCYNLCRLRVFVKLSDIHVNVLYRHVYLTSLHPLFLVFISSSPFVCFMAGIIIEADN